MDETHPSYSVPPNLRCASRILDDPRERPRSFGWELAFHASRRRATVLSLSAPITHPNTTCPCRNYRAERPACEDHVIVTAPRTPGRIQGARHEGSVRISGRRPQRRGVLRTSLCAYRNREVMVVGGQAVASQGTGTACWRISCIRALTSSYDCLLRSGQRVGLSPHRKLGGQVLRAECAPWSRYGCLCCRNSFTALNLTRTLPFSIGRHFPGSAGILHGSIECTS